MRANKKKAVILLSGGLDSSTVLYIALKKNYDCHCLLFDYGQKHKKELLRAITLAKKTGAGYTVVKISFPWNKSALIRKGGGDIKDASAKLLFTKPSSLVKIKNLPSTYVPGRNTIFISYALAYAETIGAERIFIGANAVDFSGYPDCRPRYIRAWNNLIKSLGAKIKIEAPLLALKKSEIIKKGVALGVPYELTWSCYRGLKYPCGKCDSCLLRLRGFKEAGMKDPLSISMRYI